MNLRRTDALSGEATQLELCLPVVKKIAHHEDMDKLGSF